MQPAVTGGGNRQTLPHLVSHVRIRSARQPQAHTAQSVASVRHDRLAWGHSRGHVLLNEINHRESPGEARVAFSHPIYVIVQDSQNVLPIKHNPNRLRLNKRRNHEQYFTKFSRSLFASILAGAPGAIGRRFGSSTGPLNGFAIHLCRAPHDVIWILRSGRIGGKHRDTNWMLAATQAVHRRSLRGCGGGDQNDRKSKSVKSHTALPFYQVAVKDDSNAQWAFARGRIGISKGASGGSAAPAEAGRCPARCSFAAGPVRQAPRLEHALGWSALKRVHVDSQRYAFKCERWTTTPDGLGPIRK